MCVCFSWPAQIYTFDEIHLDLFFFFFFFHSPTYSINGHNSLFRNRSFHRTRSAQTILLALLPIRQIWPSRVLSALELWAKFGAFWETAIRHHIIRLVFAHSQTRGWYGWWRPICVFFVGLFFVQRIATSYVTQWYDLAISSDGRHLTLSVSWLVF